MKTWSKFRQRNIFLKAFSLFARLLSLVMLGSLTSAYGQITPSQDAYTNTALPTTNFGAKTVLDVESASQTTFIQFDLSSIPSGYTGASVAKASLKLYVNSVATAGSFNVDFVNGTWTEKTITANLSPALGTTIAGTVPLTSANVHDYIIIDVTAAVDAWLNGTQTNDGIALVGNSPLNASFDSKENTTNSHPPELDIVFAGGGTITGVTAGPGLAGGGTSGNVTLSLLKTCAANQVLQWNGTTWVCATIAGSGTITGVTAGTDLTGGGTSGNVTLNLDTTKVPQLGGTNAFSTNNSFAGTVGIGTTAPAAQLDVEAPATAATGIQGVTSSTTFFAAGVYGHATGASGTTRGVYGVSDSTGGIGVHGIGAVGGQFETGNGTIFVGRGQGGTRVTIDSLGNTITTGAMSVGNGLTVSAANGVGVSGNSPGIGVQGVSAGSGGLGVEGVATSSGTGAVGVEGFGDVGVAGNGGTNGTGVRGSGAIGVEGTSTNGNGVSGKNTSGAAGVSGVNNGNGFGLFGFAAGSTGQGVHGESMGTSASNGFGADGVDGITHTPNGSGVAGINDGLGGTGVYGVSLNGGFGFLTPSNVSQDRSAGGWAKALIFVDPFTQNGTAITRCFNSQASGATVSTPPCGFDISHPGLGFDVIDLHFQVNDRFLSVSSGAVVTTCVQDPHTCPGNSVSQLSVATANYNGTGVDAAFWIIVF